jgi:hypothetical protein
VALGRWKTRRSNSLLMDDLVIDRTSGMGRRFVTDWLNQHPEVAATLRQRNVRVVIVEPEPGALFATTQAAIDAFEVPDGARALFVALTDVPTVAETGAFQLRNQRQQLVKMRGRFVGYIAIGEGGVVFFDESGKVNVPDAETVLALL